MARRGGNGIFGFFAVGAVTIAAGAALGYYVIGGDRTARTTPEVVGVQESPPPAPMSHLHAAATRPRMSVVQANADYTAPGAPRIHIVESQSPTLGTATQPPVSTRRSDDSAPANIPTPDAEASQEAANDGGASTSGSGVTGNSITTDAKAPASNPTPNATQVTPPPPSSAPANSAAPPADTEASQAGTAGQTTAGDKNQSSSAHVQYRLQAAGVFSTAQGAQSYADTLSGKGVPASVSSRRQDGQTVYKVQVGAFRDRSDAQQAASDLQRQGVPVTLNPATP